jgi:hypothetical protein
LVWESAIRDGEEPSHDHKDSLVGMTGYAVKNFSKTGVKIDEVLNWMTTNRPPKWPIDEFVCNLPISILMITSAGVLYFGGH